MQILHHCQRKTTNTGSTTLSAILYKHQANPLLSLSNYIPLVINMTYLNKQLSLSKQRKLALTAINKLSALYCKIIGAPKKFKNRPRPLVSPSSINFSQFFKNLSHVSVLLSTIKRQEKNQKFWTWRSSRLPFVLLLSQSPNFFYY